MTANRIIHHIFNQPDIRHVDQAELERLVETYPYFAAARLLLAQKQYIQRPDLTAPTLKKAQLYSSNPQHLHQLLTDTSLFEEAPVVAEMPVPPAVDIEETEDAISAEDQQILDEIEAEDRANAELAAQQAQQPKLVVEHILLVEDEVDNLSELDEELVIEDEFAEEEPVLENKEAITEEEEIAAEEDTLVEVGIVAEEGAIEEEVVAEEEPVTEEMFATAEEPAVEEAITTEEETIASEEQPAIEEQPAAPEQPAAEETLSPAAEEPDEIVAIDYEAITAEKAFEEARTSNEPDEVVAIDYEAIKEEKAFEAERTSDAPDEIVAIDYEALKEEVPHYEPEIEEEDIVVPAQTIQPAAGISIPAAAETTDKQTIISDDEDNEEENTEADGPIRIHPIDTPEEETVLTFQPLYTEDYFAYKKLKDPNTAEMMNDKAQAEMRSFTDWLRELKDNFIAGKATKDWYHQQMHRLYEDDEPEVSERVEKMAMESITLNDDIVSETLAEIWVRQHQHAKAIVVYQKLSLLNPDKNAYFAQKIKELQLLTDNNK